MTSYTLLKARSQEVARIHSIGSILGWDQQVCLPPSGGAERAEQNAWLAGQAHRLWTDPQVGRWISDCESAPPQPTDGFVPANVREWRRRHDRAVRVPESLVEALSRATSLAHEAWVEARRESRFPIFQPHLGRVVDLLRQTADRVGYTAHPYDALLDEYEPGWTTAEVAELFDRFAPGATVLVRQAGDIPPPGPLPAGPYPIGAQQQFNHRVAESIGFDFFRGRIDTAQHPFCTELGPDDIRLTTRYDESDFTSSLYGILHEAGHGLYEQGLSKADHGTPAGQAASLGIHESQSRLWENHIGRTRAFWEHWFEEAVRHFPQLADTDPAGITRHVNRIARSLIRVEADEVTYDLHIVVRFDLERRLVEGSLAVADLPEAWNAEYEKRLGLHVPDDSHGCLQDIHWSGGAIGYFPTYTLGNLCAAQLIGAAHRELAGLDSSLAAGDYTPLREWLRSRIHGRGHSLAPVDLIREATGSPPGPEDHLTHLADKVRLARES